MRIPDVNPEEERPVLPVLLKINQFFNGAGLNILEGYGLTETSPILTANTFHNFRYGSVGKAIPLRARGRHAGAGNGTF